MSEHEERLRAMRDDVGHGTWDLSPNDTAAIGWALAEIEALRSKVAGLSHALADMACTIGDLEVRLDRSERGRDALVRTMEGGSL